MGWICYVKGPAITNQSEIVNNTDIMYNYFVTQYGGSIAAFAGFLGNVCAESGYNPGRMEDPPNNFDAGLGLIQWTRYAPTETQNPLLDWTEDMGYNWYDGDRQMWLIMEEHNVGAWRDSDTRPQYHYTWEQFMSMTDPSLAASTYMWQRERPLSDSSEQDRREMAQFWYEYYSGQPPTPPTPTPSRRKRSIIPLICSRRFI